MVIRSDCSEFGLCNLCLSLSYVTFIACFPFSLLTKQHTAGPSINLSHHCPTSGTPAPMLFAVLWSLELSITSCPMTCHVSATLPLSPMWGLQCWCWILHTCATARWRLIWSATPQCEAVGAHLFFFLICNLTEQLTTISHFRPLLADRGAHPFPPGPSHSSMTMVAVMTGQHGRVP